MKLETGNERTMRAIKSLGFVPKRVSRAKPIEPNAIRVSAVALRIYPRIRHKIVASINHKFGEDCTLIQANEQDLFLLIKAIFIQNLESRAQVYSGG